MAAIVRHGTSKGRQLLNNQVAVVLFNGYATKAEKKKGIDRRVPPRFEWTAQSLASKGFLRSQKDYSPPADVNDRLSAIAKTVLGTSDGRLTDLNAKFEFLNACFGEFQHGVPNSLLHTIESVDDVKQFYLTPISTKTPLDKFKDVELPANLHIQHDYVRYNPETFDGKTTFPKSSTLVTGLKYKEKYVGHRQAQQWPYK
ncbi:PREDICTED: 39S ribosomal protein L50, mitochondrial isoform X2 [Nicrophorus vespilloides]|uniref:Large ribosomal subunit protein mL50 n=1 Tax=Nicrophorus vespilloides TaxID=110193 RepID=A0ABM1N435_NICVS|nr:PREDICTED: 39S ribosomal protein L50, mitochondrial isoform X2 [Nicrophorus vespilloides]